MLLGLLLSLSLIQAAVTGTVKDTSGGAVSGAKIPIGPGYQVPFAERIRREADMLTAAVGMISSPEQANTLITSGRADMVFMAREFLREPYWPLKAAAELGGGATAPVQYGRAFLKR